MSEAEFEKLFRDNFASMCNLAFTIVKSEDVAKDIVQQVFLNLWQKKNTLTIHTAIRPYLYKAVVNTGINHIKKEKKFAPLESFMEKENDENDPLKKDSDIECIHKVINKLPPVCQKVFRLSRFSNLSNKEIANELNISVKSVEKHITKAFKILRKDLKPLILSEKVIIVIFILSEVGFCSMDMSIYI